MRLSVERLRWLLVAGAVVLVGIVVAYVGYGRYRALETWRRLVKHSGASLTHDTNGFTYSQSEQGRTLYTVHAAKAVQFGDGKWALRDAELTLYSRTSNRVDHVYGAEFQYDEKTGIARAIGEVHMDLQAPQALTPPAGPPQTIRGKEGRAPSAPRAPKEDTQTIHVRTSGVMYVKALGVAATQEDVEFRYGGIEAHAQGADFDENASAVHLLANVRLSGLVHGHELTMTATKADLDRANELVSLASPMVQSQGRTVTASNGLAHLRKDGSVQDVSASGRVTMSQGTQTVRADSMESTLNDSSSPTAASLLGNVTMDDVDTKRPMHAEAQRADVAFDSEGDVKTVTANGAVRASLQERGAVSQAWMARGLKGDRVVLTMRHGEGRQMELSEAQATGNASAQAESEILAAAKKGQKPAVAGKRVTSVQADDLVASFAPGASGKSAVAQRVVGTGHARMQQTGLAGASTMTSGDEVEMAFAVPAAAVATAKPAAGAAGGAAPVASELRSAVETGHVTVRSQAAAKKDGKPGDVTTAMAQQATFDGTSQVIKLMGKAEFQQNGVEVASREMSLEQLTGNAEAEGDVLTTFAGNGPASESSHVMSDRATFTHGSQTAVFMGTDAKPAKLWQGASQVLAATLTMDGALSTLSARPATEKGLVSAVFASQGSAVGGVPAKGVVEAKLAPDAAAEAAKRGAPAKKAPSVAQVVRVSSQQMDYSDKSHEAVFSGNVAMMATGGNVRSQRAVVFFKAKVVAPAKGKEGAAVVAAPASAGQAGAAKPGGLAVASPAAQEIDRVVASGDVRLTEPGRTATGDQLLYVAATEQYVLTGTAAKPPRVVDATQGNVTGAMLVFGERDNSVVVSGDEKHRVRTEMEVRP